MVISCGKGYFGVSRNWANSASRSISVREKPSLLGKSRVSRNPPG